MSVYDVTVNQCSLFLCSAWFQWPVLKITLDIAIFCVYHFLLLCHLFAKYVITELKCIFSVKNMLYVYQISAFVFFLLLLLLYVGG